MGEYSRCQEANEAYSCVQYASVKHTTVVDETGGELSPAFSDAAQMFTSIHHPTHIAHNLLTLEPLVADRVLLPLIYSTPLYFLQTRFQD